MYPFDLILYFSISRYATTSTEESVYIIGGDINESPWRSPTIAKYSDGIWTKPGSMVMGRIAHGAITIEERIIIIGGLPQRGPT